MKSVRLVKRTGIAECHEVHLVQQRISAMLTTIFSARKELTNNHTLQTMLLRHWRLCYSNVYTKAGER